MSGEKPAFVVKMKDANDRAAKPVSLGAWWREGDRLQGGWDRSVAKVQIRMVDGAVHTITPSEGDGGKRRWSHFLNAYDNSAPSSAPRAKDGGKSWDDGGKGTPGAGASDDFDEDSIPF